MSAAGDDPVRLIVGQAAQHEQSRDRRTQRWIALGRTDLQSASAVVLERVRQRLPQSIDGSELERGDAGGERNHAWAAGQTEQLTVARARRWRGRTGVWR